jgi:hypothetical protein
VAPLVRRAKRLRFSGSGGISASPIKEPELELHQTSFIFIYLLDENTILIHLLDKETQIVDPIVRPAADDTIFLQLLQFE